jgi:hypothetical protein
MPGRHPRRDGEPMHRSTWLWWRVVDGLRRADEWVQMYEAWTLVRVVRRPGPAAIRATLSAGTRRARFWTLAVVELLNPSSRAKNPSLRPLVEEMGRALRHRGYEFAEPLPRQPLLARKRLRPSQVGGERRFLAELMASPPGILGSAPRDLTDFSESFRADRAGGWRPHRAYSERRRPIRLGGRRTEAILMFHLSPRDLRGLRLGVACSMSIWPPWTGRGRLPRWLAESRPVLARQFKAAGHKAEWIRGPKSRGVGIMSLVWLREPIDLARARRALDTAELGDLDWGRDLSTPPRSGSSGDAGVQSGAGTDSPATLSLGKAFTNSV